MIIGLLKGTCRIRWWCPPSRQLNSLNSTCSLLRRWSRRASGGALSASCTSWRQSPPCDTCRSKWSSLLCTLGRCCFVVVCLFCFVQSSSSSSSSSNVLKEKKKRTEQREYQEITLNKRTNERTTSHIDRRNDNDRRHKRSSTAHGPEQSSERSGFLSLLSLIPSFFCCNGSFHPTPPPILLLLFYTPVCVCVYSRKAKQIGSFQSVQTILPSPLPFFLPPPSSFLPVSFCLSVCVLTV